MSKIITLVCVVSTVLAYPSLGQRSGKFLLSGYADLYKTDVQEVGKKAQIGLELNHFVNNNFTLSGGIDFWTGRGNPVTLGARYYVAKRVFARTRAILKKNSDVSFGVGFYKPINNYLLIEGIADFYTLEGNAGLRAGIVYILF
ncbi:hypothetical protein QQ020_29500 [Fulvivirgaceae bacterium BMA12]|uniref:Outer membrane protein beta-barrel domain-containing protein n=1 Tax=Agaribacillus aureus TaxID=3051825 RepID=A0ABT8LEN4_9BACT|nr:hypothetical protein [Fulvivirgaceae bacterium BMA12]